MRMTSVATLNAPSPPSWIFQTGLHAPAKAGGQWVRRVRLLSVSQDGRPVSQAAFARTIGVAERTLRYWEAGEYEIPYEATRKVFVQEMRLVALGILPIEESSIGELFTSSAIPRGIKEKAYNTVINGFTAMRDRFIEESWAKSTSSV
jgi:hypothetical protein